MSSHRSPLRALGLGLLLATLPPAIQATESGWVRGEIRLNIRTGPGTQYKIAGITRTGDGAEILERREGWTRVRIRDESGQENVGWIPKGYLESEPPPSLRLAEAQRRADSLEAEITSLRERVEALSGGENERQQALQEQISELRGQNELLRAGGRYPEWITGACILGAGMILGAILHRMTERRNQTRLKI